MADMSGDVRYVRGIGEQRAKALEKLHIRTLGDLVNYFPRGYEDRTATVSIADADLEQTVCVRAMVSAAPTFSHIRRGLDLVKLRAVDEGGALDITFFNQVYIKDQLRAGETYVFYGKIGGVPNWKTMTNPLFEPENAQGSVTGRIVPIYRLTAGISQKLLMNSVRQGLEACGGVLPNRLPEAVCREYSLAQARFAYENIHFPTGFGELELARKRLIFEELFVLACAMGTLRGHRDAQPGITLSHFDIEEFYASLPFSPTGAQRRCVTQAISDMCSGLPMNRLIQGDVGSGKTLVAAACIWYVWKNGRQSAFMAPTEILTEQHMTTLSGFLSPFGIRVERLTGSMPAKDKRLVKSLLASGDIDLVIGTHALLSGDVSFSDLAFVVTDEQHRFGVEQRSALSGKGDRPHVLVMSATPIPRTLALIIYGDLEVSVIDELPPGREKVDTFAVGEDMRQRIYRFISRLVSEGRQVFIVCPMIDDNEDAVPDLKSALEYSQELQNDIFPQLRVGCVHGKMKARDKDAVMSAFVSGELDILVSTTVIEVGVDVPNAALMIVENAERFGLSQLHQLRGRVGRGSHKSYCVLFSSAGGEETRARLDIMCRTSDGFKISEADLKLRGPGDFFGSRQHGLPEMHIADLCSDINILNEAQAAAKLVLEADPRLCAEENAELRRGVDALLAANEGTLN